MITKKPAFTSVDQYISTLPKNTQKRMQEIRKTIKAIVPKAEEAISYQMAAFKVNGEYFAHFAAWKKHIGMYPIPAGDAAFRKEIVPYMSAKSSLQFPLDKPLPLKLICKVVKFRIAENLERSEAKPKKKKK
jgi:uncharacterized protein YdhG (YjbR/CyaY superfamily)